MLLTFDIGNTNIVVGGFEKKNLAFEFRLKTDPGRTIDEYAGILFSLLDRQAEEHKHPSACVISSVVPPITPDVVRLVKERFNIDALVVGPGVKTGLSIKTTDPAAVGSDRVVNAVAVKALFGSPALVVDFGTATSFDLVSKEGNYEGGIIAPGPATALEALVRNTAKLPRIELSWPKNVVGKNTVAAMQAGVVVGYACLVDGLIDKIIDEVGPIPHVVATGGLGRLFSEHSKSIKNYDPHLTLTGLRIIAELNDLHERT
ncbi:MAG: type III pantothenate kinase [Deltaproteobacteria bacterium]|nr:type III pantothenate kinase [Deltaproteobacteria bacterium]